MMEAWWSVKRQTHELIMSFSEKDQLGTPTALYFEKSSLKSYIQQCNLIFHS